MGVGNHPGLPFTLVVLGGVFPQAHSVRSSGWGGGTSTPKFFCLKVAAEEEDHFLSHEVTHQINTFVLCEVASRYKCMTAHPSRRSVCLCGCICVCSRLPLCLLALLLL